MVKRTKLATAIKLAAFGAAGAAMLSASPVIAQDNSLDALEEVIVTGSAIKRKDLDGALPVQVFGREDMDRSGVVSTGDLINKMTAMQGFTTPADSVGGGGGGLQTASIHDIGSEYTLVLLNGRRMAPADSGGTIDLKAIPMSMLQQVEVLTDGASALYGSDAIAGVVNFKLKDEVEGTTIAARYSNPQAGAGEGFEFDLSTGFGSFGQDGYSFVAAYNHSEQKQLAAADRDFAKTGILTVQHPFYQQDALFFNGSGNAIPGNARVRYLDPANVTPTNPTGLTTITFNPYAAENGSCAENTSPIGNECWFDYTSTIEIVPESTRDSVFLNGKFAINDNLTAFGTAVYSKNSTTARIAPYPTGWVPLPNDSDLVVNEVLPHLTAQQVATLQNVAGRWRALPASNRTTEYNSDAFHFVAGLEGSAGDIDYTGAFTYAQNDQEQNYPTGWLIRDEFVAAAGAGAFNIFAHPDDFTEADMAALAPSIYSGNWDNTQVTVKTIDATASKPLFEMGGGESILAVGFDYRDTEYKRTIAEANANEELLFLSPDTPYDMQRSQWGLFGEFLMPITDSLEVTASLRYDSISDIDSKGVGSVGETMDDTTYKISARWNLTDNFALRAAYGTGFKAPTMRQIAEPRSEFGVTSDSYACPFPAGDTLAQYCLTGDSQYTIFREGYAELQPEKSTQFTFGGVFQPTDTADFTVDYWNVEITDVVERLTEQQIFGDPVTYRDLFTTKTNLATNEEELAIIQAAVNAGSYEAQGVDYKFSNSFDLSFGLLTTSIGGTYMIKSESSLTGSSLGKFGENNAVTFRNRVRLGATLDQDMFSHSVSLDYKSGYRDQAQFVNLIDPATGEPDYSVNTPIQLQIPSYYTIDYQTKAMFMEDKVEVTFGINNLMDAKPHVSLRTGGAGHQVGWDPRYVDAYGRTFYLRAGYTF